MESFQDNMNERGFADANEMQGTMTKHLGLVITFFLQFGSKGDITGCTYSVMIGFGL